MPPRAIAALGGLALLGSLLLPWYSAGESVFQVTRGAGDTERVTFDGFTTAWHAFAVTDIVLAALALLTLVAAWRRPAVAAAAGAAALVLVAARLLVPPAGLEPRVGAFVALGAAALATAASWRAA